MFLIDGKVLAVIASGLTSLVLLASSGTCSALSTARGAQGCSAPPRTAAAPANVLDTTSNNISPVLSLYLSNPRSLSDGVQTVRTLCDEVRVEDKFIRHNEASGNKELVVSVVLDVVQRVDSSEAHRR